MTVTMVDNSEEYLNALEAAQQKILEAIGVQIEGQAKIELESDPARIDTNNLRKSITHTTKDDKVVVGTNVFYAVYVHEGTGKYHGGSDLYWVYVKTGKRSSSNGNGKRYTYAEAKRVVAYLRAKGLDAHMTNGMKPNRFFTNAFSKQKDNLKAIAQMYLTNA